MVFCLFGHRFAALELPHADAWHNDNNVTIGISPNQAMYPDFFGNSIAAAVGRLLSDRRSDAPPCRTYAGEFAQSVHKPNMIRFVHMI